MVRYSRQRRGLSANFRGWLPPQRHKCSYNGELAASPLAHILHSCLEDDVFYATYNRPLNSVQFNFKFSLGFIE